MWPGSVCFCLFVFQRIKSALLKLHLHAIYHSGCSSETNDTNLYRKYTMHSSQRAANDIYGRIIKRSLASLPSSLKWHLVVGQTLRSEERECDRLQDSSLWKSCVGAQPSADDCTRPFPVMWRDLIWCDVWGGGLRWECVMSMCLCVYVCVYPDISIHCSLEVAYGSLVAWPIFPIPKRHGVFTIRQYHVWVPCSEDK